RVAGTCRDQYGDADQSRNQGFLDGKPLGVEFEQTDTPGQRYAGQAEKGDKVELAVTDQFEGAPAQREGQSQNQCTVSPQAILGAELHQDEGRNQNADGQVDQRAGLV